MRSNSEVGELRLAPLLGVIMDVTPAFYRIRDVLRITALSRPTLYRRIAARRFPAPVRLGGRACGWSAVELQAWIADPDGYRVPVGAEPAVHRGPGRPRKYDLSGSSEGATVTHRR
jgi:predicted DNA-binding transcriptional regulator AlpA